MKFADFFKQATRLPNGLPPFPFQERLASQPWPNLLDVPTGMGKTAAVVLAWVWKRRILKDPATPRRLVWCLPMRVLVEQVQREIVCWLENLDLAGDPDEGKVSVHVLMGGADDLKSWAQHPEEDAIVIGTQDMLLSRALMRGYGMSRYQWPVHFALLHNDALWVLDEVQLMGAGLATTAQLEAFRRAFGSARDSRTLWVSATLNRDWLGTVDMRPHLTDLQCETLTDEECNLPQVTQRINAKKSLESTRSRLALNTIKNYIAELAQEILAVHLPNTTTLVILNRVDRAQQLYRQIANSLKKNAGDDAAPGILLLHARFRPAERRGIETRLHETPPKAGRIVVATQAIEAGVDITSRTLFTELAPWSSMVQRFGRCNRYGEANESADARVFWIDVASDGDLSAPYDGDELDSARVKLMNSDSAAAADLPKADEAAPLWPVIRRRDFLDLFNTDPDLSGFDVDISDYIRDADKPPLAVFWRDFERDPGHTQPPPSREELCPISITQAQELKKQDKWSWDSLASRWIKFASPLRPGITLLLRASDGGYDPKLGFTTKSRKPVVPIPPIDQPSIESYSEDWRSTAQHPVELAHHLADVANTAHALCERLDESSPAIVRAAAWHDVGKAHWVFQTTLTACEEMARRKDGLWAKSTCLPGQHTRPYFRHELASMLAWLETHGAESNANLVAYLIAAHHGKVRMSLRAMPDEQEAPDGRRYARGIWENDILPAFTFAKERLPATALRLEIMELGEGAQGPSWTTRTHLLLEEHGPFRLAWMESLVRIADWRASQNAPQADGVTNYTGDQP